MKPSKIEQLIEKSRYEATPDAYDKTLRSFMQTVDDYQRQKLTIPKTPVTGTIMKVTKYAAGVMFLAIIIGLHQTSSSIKGTSVVWADVVERFEKVRPYKAKAHRVLTEVGREEPFFECDIIRYFSPDHGSVEESYEDGELVMLAYCSMSEKAAFIFFPPNKVYCRFDFNEELLSMVEYINPANVDGMMQWFGSERCNRLGQLEMDGAITEGYEVKDVKIFSQVPRFLLHPEDINIRLWVDEETSLPVSVEGEGFVRKCIMTGFRHIRYEEVMYDIEYDVEIDEAIFKPDIPEDYWLIDPADLIDKTELLLLSIVPFYAIFAIYKRFKKK